MTSCLVQYPDENPLFRLGVASEFTDDGLRAEDLLAIPDLAAGAFSETLIKMGTANIPTSGSGPGGHTLWAYSRVPNRMEGGWGPWREPFADRIEARIEGLAPGFRGLIRARAVHTPEDLEAMDENLVGGDLGGGSARFSQQLFFRPVFPYFRYRTPVRGLYLASASAHPGAGVHGACGFNAARMALRDEE